MKEVYNFVSNARNVEISETTQDLIILKARVSEVYEELISIMHKINPIEGQADEELKDALLDFNSRLNHYIGECISDNLICSEYKEI